MTTLLAALEIPLLGVLLAAGLWLVLELLGRRLAPGSLGRALLLRSRISLCLTVVATSLAWWLAGRPGPIPFSLPLSRTDLRDGVISLGLIWTLLRCKAELLGKAERYSEQLFPSLPVRDRLFLFDVADKLIGSSVLILIALLILRLVGAPLAVLATTGGFGAAALGFGAKTIVENALSGISLYINRPFVVGDLIQIPDEQLTGTVEQIGWYYTCLRDLERQPIFIPNGLFTVKPVINSGRIDSRRVWIEFSLRHQDREAIEPIVTVLRQALATDAGIDQSKPQGVHFVGYGDAGLDLRLLCFSASSELPLAWDLKQRLLLAIGKVVEDHQARMPIQHASPGEV
ncbi:mechanosensitive ion channel family protein [Synechococcus sp. CS-1324]|uniref:mechanosensitive ion channel family protein n=1 Tax=Synechococcus sp. CS-1324 TaxID=2847980 RepID=UPI000DB3D099|nr:mechanosensitive ion channel family protein [Synechococcus sp. CS-1324]MCT0229599.1 mechanosensitive ion channel family protein [Synechococcus sp. CS-1324]PZV02855.1 MAG: mechanosensitive ion channel protein MscS [Cyanobium sp.]